MISGGEVAGFNFYAFEFFENGWSGHRLLFSFLSLPIVLVP
jgi:hypothetical protein